VRESWGNVKKPFPRRSESERRSSDFRSRRDLSLLAGGAQRRPVHAASPVARSWSVHVGTRKMVIYARAGRSQRKLWWKPAAILTCKSIVGPWHRGERLIEPSSSWFPPKFPSG
jgi:hypothetical protein